ncbi:MAG: B12-binding domain-containing radical SAM protein [Candidatus Eremiobacteraeota bacterium]|nr:B12-binding domain-containing radical SAM protein [Candidatus Eremiobacteraeota bacterium]
MKVTFVHQGRENLGLEMLSAVLKQAGHQVTLAYDMGLFGKNDNVFYIPVLERFFSQESEVLNTIFRSQPDILAFSSYTGTHTWCIQIAKKVKQKMDVPVVFGGCHPTLVPDRVMESPVVDFVIIGEGEVTFPILLSTLEQKGDLAEVPSLAWKKDGEFIQNPLAEPVANLDSLPYPDKELFKPYLPLKDDYVIMTSRGCPNHCIYCGENFTNRLYNYRFFRRRSIENSIQELKNMKKRYKFRTVTFNDPIFFTDRKWLFEFMEVYKKEIGLPFRCFGQVRYLDDEIASLLKKSGCYCVEFGLQTWNENIRKDLQTPPGDNEIYFSAFKACDRHGLLYDIDHMFGLPGETEEDFRLGTTFYKELTHLNRIKCHHLTYYPRLPIIELAREQGIIDDKKIEDLESAKEKGDFFHPEDFNSNLKGYLVLYKILPLLSSSRIEKILKGKGLARLGKLPGLVINFLQLLLAIKKRDFRFWLYFKYYPLRFFRKFFPPGRKV